FDTPKNVEKDFDTPKNVEKDFDTPKNVEKDFDTPKNVEKDFDTSVLVKNFICLELEQALEILNGFDLLIDQPKDETSYILHISKNINPEDLFYIVAQGFFGDLNEISLTASDIRHERTKNCTIKESDIYKIYKRLRFYVLHKIVVDSENHFDCPGMAIESTFKQYKVFLDFITERTIFNIQKKEDLIFKKILI
ncbi:hypothetical protein NGRA_3593, partial [Nosema granulosis]